MRSLAAPAQLDGATMHPTLDDLRLISYGSDGKKGSAAPTLADGEVLSAPHVQRNHSSRAPHCRPPRSLGDEPMR